MFALDHNLNEKQVEATVEILSIFSNRLNGEKESLNLRKTLRVRSLMRLALRLKKSLKRKPTRKEFESYKDKIFSSEIETKYLLMSLQRQHIKPNVCEFYCKIINENFCPSANAGILHLNDKSI